MTQRYWCFNDDKLITTNHGAMIQEVLLSCRAYDVKMKARKLSRLGYVRVGWVSLGFCVSLSIQINKAKEVNK